VQPDDDHVEKADSMVKADAVNGEAPESEEERRRRTGVEAEHPTGVEQAAANEADDPPA
jgi:hypothetical protein